MMTSFPNLSPRPAPQRAAVLATALAAALLAGCGSLMQTPSAPPAVELPAQWQQGGPVAAGPSLAPAQRWWQGFGDPALDALVQEALVRNNGLAAAAIRVRRAQLQAGLAGRALQPRFDASLSASSSRSLGSADSPSTQRSATASVSWEADLWGRLARSHDAARWEAQASAEDREAVALSLVATTASLYWQLGYLNQRVAYSEQSIGTARRTLALVEVQRAAGAVSDLELREAQRALAVQQAAHTQLLQQRVEARYALALLFDGPPQSPRAEPAALAEGPLPAVEAGLPAQLLARRPDLRAAEARLRGLIAAADARRADFYPRLSLTGSLGASSGDLARAVSNPIGTLGAALLLPFLQWPDLRLNLQVAQADYDAAVVEFRQTLYQALGEVENALSARGQSAAQAERLQGALDAAREAERIYELRYRAGAVALKPWLDAQEARRQAEVALLQNRLDRLLNQATLHQALGGDAVAPQDGAAGG